MIEDTSSSLIIDFGSGYCKAGLSKEDFPKYVIPTLVGY